MSDIDQEETKMSNANGPRLGRRAAARLMVAAGVSAAAAPRLARAQDKPIRIGVLSDMTGVYSDSLGPGSVLATRMAVQDFGGKVGNRPVEVLIGDHQNQPDIGLTIATEWIDRNGVDAIVDLPNSAVALAVANVCKLKNKVALPSGAGSSLLTGTECSPNIVHWTYDNYAIAHALPAGLIEQGARKWFFVTPDYTSGHDIETQATEAIKASGGTVLGDVLHPIGAADMTSYIVQADTSGADAIGLTSSGDDVNNFVKQAAEFGVTQRRRIAAFNMVVNNVVGIGLDTAQHLIGTEAFYWDLNDGTRAFGRRFAEGHPHHNMPNQMQAGAYGVTLHWLKAVARLGKSEDGAAVVKTMKQLPTDDPLFGKGSIRADGRTMHPMYLFEVKSPGESSGRWDVYKRIGEIPADKAFRPLGQGGCTLAG